LNHDVATAKIGHQLRALVIAVLTLLGSAAWVPADTPEVRQLRLHLKTAEEAGDKAAIIELSRRIVAIDPKNSDTWDRLAQTQLEIEDFDRLEQTLDAWQKAGGRRVAPAIEDFRAAVCFKRKDYQCAEHHWLAFIATKPPKADVATDYDNLAELCAAQERWEDHAVYRTKAIAAQDSAVRRVARACAFLRLHKWDAAYANMAKASKMDPTDSQVKEWLPQFEQLEKFLPDIKALDAQIVKSPNDPALAGLLLDRAGLFTLAGRPLLALDDAEHALKLQPASMRARIQTAEALLGVDRAEDAAKLQVSDRLARAEDRHVSEEALRELGANDALLAQDPKNVDALVARSAVLRSLKQFTLALADAHAALAINDKSAAAHFEAATSLYNLGRTKDALTQVRMATELDPNDPMKWFCRGVAEAARADFFAAIQSQTRSINIRETVLALHEREKCERRIGKISEADADLRRTSELGSQHE
jgi:tetratricopeptide (TPR) repeat protein